MEVITKEIYSEVYGILNLLGDKYISKLPNSLYKMIENKKSETYNPTYNSINNLKNQIIKRESISMIALFHLNFWCKTEEEKQELRKIFKENEIKHQTELQEKYSVDNLFKNRKSTLVKEEIIEEQEKSLTTINKENIFKKIINRIMKIFKKYK